MTTHNLAIRHEGRGWWYCLIFISWNILVSLQVSPLPSATHICCCGWGKQKDTSGVNGCRVRSVSATTQLSWRIWVCTSQFTLFPTIRKQPSSKCENHFFFANSIFFYRILQHFHHPFSVATPQNVQQKNPPQTACDSSPSPHPLVLPWASDRAVYQAPPTLIQIQKAPLTVSFNVTTVVNTPLPHPLLGLTPSKEPPRTTKR